MKPIRLRRLGRIFAAAILTILSLAGPGGRASAAEAPIQVFGHQNPDTDSIVGALAAAELLNRTGRPAVAAAQGPVNPETAFVLKRFGLPEPAPVPKLAGQRIGLVDFSDASQGPADLADAKLVFIADHHKLGGLRTAEPLEAWIQPVGSVNTILFEVFKLNHLDISKSLAGGMLCAILSDTVIYKSVTTTPRDRDAAAALAKLAGVKDVRALGLDLFRAKSAIAGVPARDLVIRDYKTFVMGGTKVGVGQLELVDLALVAGQKDGFLAAMEQVKREQGLHSIFLMLTDIMRESTEMLVVTDDPAKVQKAFPGEIKGHVLLLPGVMSRKKQVVPNLEAAFKS
jgi:manganese-dependent inorganic pyrophosphatase